MSDNVRFVTINGIVVPIKDDYAFLYKESERWSNELTSKEMHCIKKYTKNSLETGNEKNSDKFFAKMNQYLRCKENGIYDKFYEEYSDSISSGISKFHLAESMVCYRGSNYDETNNTQVGGIFTNPSFCSTSINKKLAFNKKYSYTIYVPKNSRCAFVYSISKFKWQKELLIDKSTKYRVVSINDDDIELEIVA